MSPTGVRMQPEFKLSNKTKGAFFLTTGIGLLLLLVWIMSCWQVAAMIAAILAAVALCVAGLLHLTKEDWM